MKRVLFDEDVPRQLRRALPGFEIKTVQEQGWSSLRNGELLRVASIEFDVLLTADRNLPYQQNIPRFEIGVVVLALRDSRLPRLQSISCFSSSIFASTGPWTESAVMFACPTSTTAAPRDVTAKAKAIPIPFPSGRTCSPLQHIHRAFVMRALIAARDGTAAWDELRTTWELTRPLWGRPEPTSVLAASTAARMVNGAARKMPLPPPAWLAELDTFPYEQHLAAAQQAEAWRGQNPGLTERLRGMAAEVVQAKACDATSPQFDAVREKLGARATPNLIANWERLMRFRAEREARRNVLRIRAGHPPTRDSQCSDGSWDVTPTSFKFTREAPVERPQIRHPLEYGKGTL